MPADAPLGEFQSLEEALLRSPKGVICLLSALRFHNLTTQNPRQVWLALPPRSRRPQLDYPPVRVVTLTGQALTEGVQEHRGESVVLRVYSPAKTVADCFKFRHQVGLNIALEAMKDGWRQRRFTMDELWRFAQIDRVANVIRPYLEALPE